MKKILSIFLALTTTLVLVTGVVAAPFARGGPGGDGGFEPVTLCHASPTGAGGSGPATSYELVTVDNQGQLNGHLNHPNDIIPAPEGGCPTIPPPPVLGCTDPTATNYNPDATENDGSCQYPPPPVLGCTDPTATNYNPDATENDGSCTYPPPPPEPIYGCTDPTATNYNPEADTNDGSCTYPPPPVTGCTDPTATNYNPDATENDGSCQYPPPPVVNPCADGQPGRATNPVCVKKAEFSCRDRFNWLHTRVNVETVLRWMKHHPGYVFCPAFDDPPERDAKWLKHH